MQSHKTGFELMYRDTENTIVLIFHDAIFTT